MQCGKWIRGGVFAGLVALLVGIPMVGGAYAASPAVDVVGIAHELEVRGIGGGREIALAVEAHRRGEKASARARLDAGLLANGIVDVRHAGAIHAALKDIASRSKGRTIARFLSAWMDGATGKSGLRGVMTAAGFRAMKKAGGAVDPPRGEGGVVLQVSPSNAEVRVDGILSQGSPAVFRDVPAGFRAVEVRAPGFRAVEGVVRVEALRVTSGRVQLEPAGAVLRIESNPSGASVTVGGASRGDTPVVVDGLETGNHRVVVSLEGRQDWSQNVRIKRGENRVEATLVPLPIRLVVAPPVVKPLKPAVVATPKVTPAPAPAPAPKKAAEREGADLRLLSKDLQAMTWESLRGRAVEIEVKGRRATVVVVALQGDVVIVQPPGKTRRFKVPINDIEWVVQ